MRLVSTRTLDGRRRGARTASPFVSLEAMSRPIIICNTYTRMQHNTQETAHELHDAAPRGL